MAMWCIYLQSLDLCQFTELGQWAWHYQTQVVSLLKFLPRLHSMVFGLLMSHQMAYEPHC